MRIVMKFNNSIAKGYHFSEETQYFRSNFKIYGEDCSRIQGLKILSDSTVLIYVFCKNNLTSLSCVITTPILEQRRKMDDLLNGISYRTIVFVQGKREFSHGGKQKV